VESHATKPTPISSLLFISQLDDYKPESNSLKGMVGVAGFEPTALSPPENSTDCKILKYNKTQYNKTHIK